MTVAHRYLRGVGRSSAPSLLVTAVAETDSVPGRRSSDVQYRRAVAVHATRARWGRGRWFGVDGPTRLSVPDWWDWLEECTAHKRRVWVIAPTASDFLTLTGFWDLSAEGRFRLIDYAALLGRDQGGGGKRPKPWVGRLIMAGRPDIIDTRAAKGTITFLSARNYGDFGTDELALWLNHRPDGGGGDRLPSAADPVGAARLAGALGELFRGLIAAWVRDGNGPWRETIAQCALSLWRARFYDEQICRHDEPEAKELEADANYGGRASVWFWGSVGDPASVPADGAQLPPLGEWRMPRTSAHRLDVRSMYPALLRDKEFPTRLLSVIDGPTEDRWEGFIKHTGLIASVEIETELPEFPHRDGDRLRFPVGRFWTVLAGPELIEAQKRGFIRRIGRCARYAMGRPFAGLASYLLAERSRHLDRGNSLGAAWVKLLANSFGGKFSQRADTWIPSPGCCGGPEWGEWIMDRGPQEEPWRMRSIAGVPFRLERGKPGGRLLSAVFAYLTAYGRVQMFHLRSLLGSFNVLSQDTDGLWVTDAGLELAERLELLGEDAPGQLRYVESVGFARWFSPRHYYAGGQWTLAGIAADSVWVGPAELRERTVVNPIRHRPTEPARELTVYERYKALGELEPDTPVDAVTGWGKPLSANPDAWEAIRRKYDRRGPVDLFDDGGN